MFVNIPVGIYIYIYIYIYISIIIIIYIYIYNQINIMPMFGHILNSVLIMTRLCLPKEYIHIKFQVE